MISIFREEWRGTNSTERLAFYLVAIVSAISLILGVLNYPVIGHDAYVHLNWLDQFSRLREQGIAYPRWLPESFGGFGAPTFYFYPPLVYWCAGLLYACGINSANALYNCVQLIFSMFSCWTAYHLLRQFTDSRVRSLVGALVYSFLAYRFCDVYVRDALTEHAALAFVPLVFLAEKRTMRWLGTASLARAALLFTNLPIAFISFLSIAIMLVVKRSRAAAWMQLASLGIAFFVSASYLAPAIGLRPLIHSRHLLDLPMHTSQFGYALVDLAMGHFDWLRVLSVATVIAAVIFVVSFLKNRVGGDRSSTAWSWILIVTIFLQVPYVSAPVWHMFPGLGFVQFSWRWNGLALLAIAVIFVTNHRSLLTCTIIGLALVTLLSALTLSRNIFHRPPEPINAYRMEAPEYAPKWATSDPSQVMGLTMRWMNAPAAAPLGVVMPGDTIYPEKKTPLEQQYHARLSRATSVRFHQFYWPYWKLYQGGVETPMSPDPNGIATAVLPLGEYAVTLRLEESPSEASGMIAMWIGVALLVAIFAADGYRSMVRRRETT